ncbi:MAG TPA: MBL fold metallo-hydrolase [Candidatus Binatia bacterium]|nr:MBL fold metallo-hydrolase [Candidatus Binatia bacterium]
MKKLIFILLLVGCVSWANQSPWASEAGTRPPVMKWLGNAGWEIKVGSTVILVDPFLTRKQASPSEEWRTNEEEVLRNIEKADFIFAGHSHADHVADIPFIAKRFGSKIIGSRTTINICLTAGVDKSQLTEISGGEKFDFKDFSVEVIESQHGVVNRGGRRRQPRSQELLEQWSGPIRGEAFVEGGSYLYYFTFGKLRVLHQSTGNFIEERIKNIRPDVALLADNRNYHWPAALELLRPKTVVIHHYDQWRTPLSEGIPKSNRRRAQRFEQVIKSFDSKIRVIIPELLKTVSLE